jgi:hypothetical protein
VCVLRAILSFLGWALPSLLPSRTSPHTHLQPTLIISVGASTSTSTPQLNAYLFLNWIHGASAPAGVVVRWGLDFAPELRLHWRPLCECVFHSTRRNLDSAKCEKNGAASNQDQNRENVQLHWAPTELQQIPSVRLLIAVYAVVRRLASKQQPMNNVVNNHDLPRFRF